MLARPAIALPLLIALLMFVVACGGGSDDDDPTSTPPASTATGVPTTAASDAIRELDLEASEPVQAIIDETGGEYVQENVLYGDLTDDSLEEAVVPISSGGTLGDVAFVVLQLDGDDLSTLLRVDAGEHGVSVSIDDGKLVAVVPEPGPDDPECCPSQIKTTVYAWDGSALSLESQETTSAGGANATATPYGLE